MGQEESLTDLTKACIPERRLVSTGATSKLVIWAKPGLTLGADPTSREETGTVLED